MDLDLKKADYAMCIQMRRGKKSFFLELSHAKMGEDGFVFDFHHNQMRTRKRKKTKGIC